MVQIKVNAIKNIMEKQKEVYRFMETVTAKKNAQTF